MLDIKYIRDNTELVKKKLTSRKEDAGVIDLLLSDYKLKLEILNETEKLQSERNKTSDKIAVMMRNKENTDDIKSGMKVISDKVKTLEEELKSIDLKISSALRDIPSLPDDSVPFGKDASENVEIKVKGDKKSFSFKPKDHLELSKKLNILDFERGAKITGSGFALYMGKGATLERSLINFMLDTHIENGYTEVMTPVLVNRASMEAAEKVPKFEEDMYHMEKDDLFAIPTSEVPIINIHRNEILKEESLPIKYSGFSSCFRREAGSYGKDTKGFLRVHQFNKVELINFSKPEDSYSEMEKMLNDACRILDALKIHYRIIELCTGDLSFSASKCYDIEVWSYAEDKWLEASSVSNCTDFQSRRGEIRYKKKLENGKFRNEFVHLLNGSGLATSRLMVSLLESNQDENGNIIVPEVLRKYTGWSLI
ncbi:serine--tRNA ligase [soil metagenome]